jgi:hypothetical protein
MTALAYWTYHLCLLLTFYFILIMRKTLMTAIQTLGKLIIF